MATATRAATIPATAAAAAIRRPAAVREVFKGGKLLPPAPRTQVMASLSRPHLLPQHLAPLYLPHTGPPSPSSLSAADLPEEEMLALQEAGRTQPVEFAGAAPRLACPRAAEREVELRAQTPVVMGTWLGAKEKHAHYYTDLYRARGHPVLIFSCTVDDMLRPKTGAEVTAARVREYLASLHPSHRAVLHSISVGGYIMQHVLKSSEPDIKPRVAAQIYDSFTNWQNLPEGVASAVPPYLSKFGKLIGDLYVKYADMSSFKTAAEFAYHGAPVSPVLFMHSMADGVAQYGSTKLLLEASQARTTTDRFLLPASLGVPHVRLLRHLEAPVYAAVIERFLENHLDMESAR